MGFYENVKQTADVAGKEIGKLTDLAKVKFELFDAQNELKSLFEKLGRAIYFDETDETVISIKEKIDAKKELIETLENRVSELQNKKTCPNCNKKNKKDAEYCCYCGSKL